MTNEDINSASALLTDDEIEAHLRGMFEENYETLKLESSQSLTPYIKEIAYQQVLRYWQKLRDVAMRVTDTEVRLTLPEQRTPHGRNYTIEGVVDIVREDDRTVMYDIKTHDADYVRTNCDLYEKQLNVYANIWQALRGQPLDETAIIATAFPAMLTEAIQRRDEAQITREMARWEPLIEIPLDQSHVEATIEEFGTVVDEIEEKRFAPPPVERLKERIGGTPLIFATQVCRNCDSRFSCTSYRNYAASATHNRIEFKFSQFFGDLETEAERTERIIVNLDVAPPPSESADDSI